jgi:hypothetical protein
MSDTLPIPGSCYPVSAPGICCYKDSAPKPEEEPVISQTRGDMPPEISVEAALGE